jgi:membrane protease YdiL (CAAX protease family)
MRRVISILLIIFTSNLVLAAVRNLPLPQFANFSRQFDVGHAVSGGIFVILLGIHLWLNRKPLARYFGKLRWWWILVGIGFAGVVWGGVVMTLIVAQR